MKGDDDNFFNVYLQGNISEKVSYLTLTYLNVSFINEEMNTSSLSLINSVINDKSLPIRSTNLIVDLETQIHIIQNVHRMNLISVDQYGINIFDQNFDNDPSSTDYIPYYMRILYENDRWKLQMKMHIDDEYTESNVYLPYS